MALVKSQTWSAISGSVGGVTWARSSAGYYMRARVVPVNPASANQNDVRNAMSILATQWVETLSAAARSRWTTYGLNVLQTNPLGDTFNASGQNWFLGNNTGRLQAAAKLGITAPVVQSGPVIFDRGSPGTIVSATASAATGINIPVGGAPPWAANAASYALVYMGLPINATRLFFRGPYRLVGSEFGNAVPITAITIPKADMDANGYVTAAGDSFYLKVVIYSSDGRVTSPIRLGPLTMGA